MVCDEDITCRTRLIDGVLFNFGKSVQEYLTSLNIPCDYPDGVEEPQSWSFYRHWGMTDEQFVSLCHDGVDAGYIFRNNVHDGAVDAVRRIKKMGHQIIIVTDRNFGHPPTKSKDATRDWWRWAGFPRYNELHFTSDKTSVPTDIFVEDKIKNYEALVSAGTECYLINRAWNYRGRDGRKRIDSIAEFPDMVEKLLVD